MLCPWSLARATPLGSSISAFSINLVDREVSFFTEAIIGVHNDNFVSIDVHSVSLNITVGPGLVVDTLSDDSGFGVGARSTGRTTIAKQVLSRNAAVVSAVQSQLAATGRARFDYVGKASVTYVGVGGNPGFSFALDTS